MSVTLEEENEDESLDFEPLRRCRARGEGDSSLGGVRGESLSGVDPVFVLSCCDRVSADLRADGPLGVTGEAEPEEDDCGGGRGKFLDVEVFVVFISFVGRVGEPFL